MSIASLIKRSYLLLFFLIPLIFTSQTSELFEFPKILVLYAGTIIIVALHLANHFCNHAPLIRRTTLTVPMLLFLTSQIISTIISIDPHISIFGYYSRFNGGLLSTLCYLLLYFVIVNYIDDIFIKKIINISLATGLLIALYAIGEHFGASFSCYIFSGQFNTTCWVQDVQARVFATLGQPNWLAAYLCILLPFSIFKSISSDSFIHKSFFILHTSVLFLALLFTKSQSGIAAALISIVIFASLHVIARIRQTADTRQSDYTRLLHFVRNDGLPLTATILIIIISTLTITNPLKDKIFHTTTSYSPPANNTINVTPSGDIRKIVWDGALKLGLQHPLFGTGVETFAESYYWVRPAAHNLTSEWDFLYNKAHNEYLNFLATTGFFGLITYLIVIIAILITYLKSPSLINLALLASFASILITNFFGFSVVITSLYFFLLPALISIPNQPNPDTQKTKKWPLLIIVPLCLLGLAWVASLYQSDLLYAQADSQDNREEYPAALDSIQLALQLQPREPTFLVKAASLAAKTAILASGQKDDSTALSLTQAAINNSNRALLISPFNVNFWKERAQTFYYLSSLNPDYYQKAIQATQKATQLAPTDTKSFYLLGYFYQLSSKTDQSIANYQQAISLKPNYDYAYFALGEIYFKQKKYDLAKTNFTKVLEIAPNNQQAKDYLNKISN